MRPRSAPLVFAALAGLGLAGCGASKATSVDTAGDGGPIVVGATRSFDVTATLALVGGAVPPNNLPPVLSLTLVLDPGSRRAIVGGHGLASVVRYTTANGRITLPPFTVGLPSAQCDGASTIDFTSLVVTVSDSDLTGAAVGAVRVSCGDCQFDVPFKADVSGTVDATPPLLFPGTVPGNPFQSFSLATSEPLPTTATARLLMSDGSQIDLAPNIVPGEVPVIAGFTSSNLVLPYGVGIAVAFDGLVDFAGQRGAASESLRLTEFPTPPLVPEDGFESATGAQLGGANVISGGPLPPIAGARSLYFGGPGTPAPTDDAVGQVLRVRLAVQPGDSTLRFAYRMVGVYAGSGFGGTINVGSVGHASVSDFFAMSPLGTEVTWPNGRTAYLTDVATKEIALPAEVTDEVLVDMESFGFGCGGPAPPEGGMLIDDLRIE